MKRKKMIIFIISIILLSTLTIVNITHSLNNQITIQDNITKTELYSLILNNKINYKDQKFIDIITNWYSYFEREDMFLTKDGEYIDYTTYEIYRVHLENQYENNSSKIAKRLLNSNNYPKEENYVIYENYINEYINTTGKEI